MSLWGASYSLVRPSPIFSLSVVFRVCFPHPVRWVGLTCIASAILFFIYHLPQYCRYATVTSASSIVILELGMLLWLSTLIHEVRIYGRSPRYCRSTFLVPWTQRWPLSAGSCCFGCSPHNLPSPAVTIHSAPPTPPSLGMFSSWFLVILPTVLELYTSKRICVLFFCIELYHRVFCRKRVIGFQPGPSELWCFQLLF